MSEKRTFLKLAHSTKPKDKKDTSNIESKLRRLKIEESLLLQDLQKLNVTEDYEMMESKLNSELDYNNTVKKIKNSHYEITNIFDEIETVSHSQELLAELDINEIKNKVFDLETAVKSFKMYIDTELRSTKATEQEILKQMEYINIKETNLNKKRAKIPLASYNQVVPSPVRILVTSPFKSTEVQEFQDFMKNSPNRYGGWNEYYHNIFVKYWQKHFGVAACTDFTDSFVENLAFDNFVEEVLFKLQVIDKENLMSHINWYQKYLFLKNNQQKAIDKWKSIRRPLKKVPEKVTSRKHSEEDILTKDNSIDDKDNNTYNEIACNFINASKVLHRLESTPKSKKSQCTDLKSSSIAETTSIRKKIGKDEIDRMMKPTKQWLNRNINYEQPKQHMNFIENLEKLRIPNWRQYL